MAHHLDAMGVAVHIQKNGLATDKRESHNAKLRSLRFGPPPRRGPKRLVEKHPRNRERRGSKSVEASLARTLLGLTAAGKLRT